MKPVAIPFLSRGRKGAFLSLYLPLLVLAALAQQSSQPPQQAALQADGTVPRFSSTSNLVIVDVTVKAKSGQPIENLKPGDFIVTEDGKVQKIAVFEFQKLT